MRSTQPIKILWWSPSIDPRGMLLEASFSPIRHEANELHGTRSEIPSDTIRKSAVLGFP